MNVTNFSKLKTRWWQRHLAAGFQRLEASATFLNIQASAYTSLEHEAIMVFEKDDSIFPESRSYPKVEHLSYLNRPPSLFEDEDDEALKQTRLLCAACNHPITKVAEKTEIFGRHDHTFPYFNQMVQLGCFLNAPGSIGIERISHGYSWFRGYAWQIQLCENCKTQLGWKYTSQNDSFYGFVFNTLREEMPEERSRHDDGDARE